MPINTAMYEQLMMENQIVERLDQMAETMAQSKAKMDETITKLMERIERLEAVNDSVSQRLDRIIGEQLLGRKVFLERLDKLAQENETRHGMTAQRLEGMLESYNDMHAASPTLAHDEANNLAEPITFLRNDDFRQACQKGDLEMVRTMLRDPLVDPSCLQNECLKIACSKGYKGIVSLLLDDSRVDPCEKDHIAFRIACTKGHDEIVDMLLRDARVDPCARDNMAFRNACTNGHDKIVDMLLKDARVDPCDRDNMAFRSACWNGHAKVVALLMGDTRVDPTYRDNIPFRNACANGHVQVVELLLRDSRILASLIQRDVSGNLKYRTIIRTANKEIQELLRNSPIDETIRRDLFSLGR